MENFEQQMRAGLDMGKALSTAVIGEEQYHKEQAYLESETAVRQKPICPQCASDSIGPADCDVKNGNLGFQCDDCGHMGFFEEFYKY